MVTPRAQIAPTPSSPPAVWTGAWVRGRLREAFDVDRRMPGLGRRNGGSWPAIVHTFADLVGWHDLRGRGLHGGVTPQEIARMDEALAWFAILVRHPAERTCLEAWARSIGSLSRELERMHIARATFYRRVTDASDRIANVLNQRGVTVR
jgi:hypothetical protein